MELANFKIELEKLSYTQEEVSDTSHYMVRPSYAFGFNGMEKDDEVSGSGNSYTAMFWQYDPRLGRRWNTDPVFKPSLSGYSCFSDNPILYIDPNGDDDLTFDENGDYVSGKERGKLFEFFFGSRGRIVDSDGNVQKKFKFADRKDGQIESFKSTKGEYNGPTFEGINLKFEGGISEVQKRIENAPNSLAKYPWIADQSVFSEEEVRIYSDAKLDFTLNPVSSQSRDRLNLVGNRVYNFQDAGNFLWGRSMKLLKIDYVYVLAGAEINATFNSKKQNPKIFGYDIANSPWWRQLSFGDSQADRRSIRKGYNYEKPTD